jgi:hypothetical protein
MDWGRQIMQLWCVGACVGAALVSVGLLGDIVQAGPVVSTRKDGGFEIAGRPVECGKVRTRLDRNLPGLGAAAPSAHLLILNPTRLQRQPDNVRLFVFYHECGHHHVGASELQADSWAVQRGVREGWLDRAVLTQVCASFRDMPETPTHPSAARRCRNLDVTFASATATVLREAAAEVKIDDKLDDVAAGLLQTHAQGLQSGPTDALR